MRTKFFSALLISITGIISLVSCQKEIDGSLSATIIPPANQEPKLGTKWEYIYSSYYSSGSLRETYRVTHTAVSEELLGGEKWLRIIDDSQPAVLFLNVKADGLYQYANTSANLFCKDPAVLNETYTTYNDGATEVFTVKGIKDSILTGPGTLAVNYYEGVKAGMLTDKIWYNDKVWIAQKHFFRKPPLGQPYKYSSLVLQDIYY